MGAAATAAVTQAMRVDPDVGRFQRVRRMLAEAPVQIEASRYDARELWEFEVRAFREVFAAGAHVLDLDETEGVNTCWGRHRDGCGGGQRAPHGG